MMMFQDKSEEQVKWQIKKHHKEIKDLKFSLQGSCSFGPLIHLSEVVLACTRLSLGKA